VNGSLQIFCLCCALCLSGYGIFATEYHERGSFLLDYAGKLMTAAEGNALPSQDYIYYFQWKGAAYA